jgi:hypothetical protein
MIFGKWNGLEVYDVFEKNYGLKQIIVKLREGEYKFIYSLWPADAQANLEPSKIE